MSHRVFGLFLFASLTAAACDAPCIDAKGDEESESRDVDAFDSIKLKATANIELTQSNERSFSMRGYENYLSRLEVLVHDRVLYVRDKDGRCFESENAPVIEISTPTIRRVSITDEGSIAGTAPIAVDHLGIDVSGEGEVTLDVIASEIDSDISGSGEVTLSGTATHHGIDISGSGRVEAFELDTLATTIDISGSGKAYVSASEHLDIDISGSGTVRYKGEPDVDKDISGSGSVKRAE